MHVVQYRYRLHPGTAAPFRDLMDRVHPIYKECGALYHIVLVGAEGDGEVCETLMFLDPAVHDRFRRLTAEHLELGYLLGKFTPMVASPVEQIEERIFRTLFDQAG